jgi:hypothetical protein
VRARGEEAKRGEAQRGTGGDTETCFGGWLELKSREGEEPPVLPNVLKCAMLGLKTQKKMYGLINLYSP